LHFGLLLSGSLAWSLPALACSPVPGAGIRVPKHVPKDGVVAFADCATAADCARFDGVTVTDASGATVPGELHTNAGKPYRAYWQPTAPLEVGASYDLTYGNGPYGNYAPDYNRTFTVVDAVSLRDVTISVSLALHSDVHLTCCESNRFDSCGSCTPSSESFAPAVRVSLGNAEDALGQVSFRVRSNALGWDSYVGALDDFVAEQTWPQSGRACVSVFAVALDGSETKLDEQCVEGTIEVPPDRTLISVTCPARSDWVRPDAGAQRDASTLRDASAPRDASTPGDAAMELDTAPGDGCQLGNPWGSFSTALILLALAASGRRPRRH
jgi:hypothetical protein